MSMNIAIDGPAGAGKSTIAKMLAKQLGFIYVDTGAMYRAMAYNFLSKGINTADEEAITEACTDVDVTIAYENGEQQVLLNGENVNGVIRTEEVGNTASAVSAYSAVRAKLMKLQKQLAAKSDVIMDGRDIGSCVLPEAQVKIYLTASTAVRAKRRYDELTAKGISCDLMQIERDIEARDERDMQREISPLVQAKDAVLIDSSELSINEVVQEIYQICQKCMLEKMPGGMPGGMRK